MHASAKRGREQCRRNKKRKSGAHGRGVHQMSAGRFSGNTGDFRGQKGKKHYKLNATAPASLDASRRHPTGGIAVAFIGLIQHKQGPRLMAHVLFHKHLRISATQEPVEVWRAWEEKLH